jgi:hypothetical protein
VGVLCGALLAVSLFAGAALAGNWEKIDEDDGIVVYRKEVPNSPLLAFRGDAIVDAPIEKVLWVLGDNDHRTDWVDRLAESVILERKGAYDFVVYQHFALPFPMTDRDYVYRGRAFRDAKGSVIVSLESVTHPKAPTPKGVRADLVGSRYILTPKGNKTLVTVEIMTDPKGNVPAWLVNVIQKSWPTKTLTGLREQVQKDFVKSQALPPAAPAK